MFYLILLELKRVIFKVKYVAEVDVTDNCNLRCKHCYHFHGKTDFKTQELSIHVWKQRFNELYKSGIRAILLVGGEPALRIDVLLVADKVFPYVWVITNGTIKFSVDIVPTAMKIRGYTLQLLKVQSLTVATASHKDGKRISATQAASEIGQFLDEAMFEK